MGVGLPDVIGVPLLDLMVFVEIDGDGSFTMNVHEIQFGWRIFALR